MAPPGREKRGSHHTVRFTGDDMPKYKCLESSDSTPNYGPQSYPGPGHDSGAPSPDACSFQPAAQRFRLNEQRIKLLTSINQVVQQRADLESNRITLSNLLDELRRKIKKRIDECHAEKKERMKSLKQANQRLEKEKFNIISEIEHLKRHLEKEEAHHLQHARTVVAQAIQGVVTKCPQPDTLFNSCAMADLPNVVSRNVAKNAPSRILCKESGQDLYEAFREAEIASQPTYVRKERLPAFRTVIAPRNKTIMSDNKLAAARLMRDIAELRQRVAQVEARLANELRRKRQAELDIIRLRKELSSTKSYVASLRLPPPPLRKQCSKFA